MINKLVILGLTAAASVFPAAGWALTSPVTTTLSADNTLGFTSNASLSATPVADFYDRVGATLRFPVGSQTHRFSARYTQYFSETQNNLLALDYAAGWKASTATQHEVRVFTRNFVNEEVGTTDQAFSRFGAAWNASWAPSPGSSWTFRPEVEIDHYSAQGRSDLIGGFQFEHDFLGGDSDASLSLGLTPGANLSTTSDFSRAYVNIALTGDWPSGEDAFWGASLDLTYSHYLARESSASVLSGRKKNSLLTTITSKESTWLVTPDLYWSKALSKSWDFRAEALANFQNSASGSYDFREVQFLATIRWRLGL